MKTNNGFWIPATLATLFSLFLTNCTKDVTIPILTTNEITDVTETTATSGGSISSDGGANITERGICWSTSQNPTIADFKTINGTESSTFTSTITGLTANRTYYLRAYATNRKGTGYGNSISFTTLDTIFNPNITYGTVTDIDGNTYKTVTIGSQTWMAENLKVSKYNDGTSISNITDSTEWANLTTGAFCDYENNPSNSETYGKLYNWYAANNGKLAPTGWHVPTNAEWTSLENYLIANGYNYDGTTTENKIAKAMGSSHGWASDLREGAIGNADYPEKQNASGFSALPGGLRYEYGRFERIGRYGYWWSSSDETNNKGYFRSLGAKHFLYFGLGYKEAGFSIRCIKD